MGILKPLDKGDAALKSFIFFSFLIGLPLTYFMAFNLNWKTVGINIAFATHQLLNDLALVYIMIKTDWK